MTVFLHGPTWDITYSTPSGNSYHVDGAGNVGVFEADVAFMASLGFTPLSFGDAATTDPPSDPKKGAIAESSDTRGGFMDGSTR